jgi:AcrR family transcriptional regulator
VSLSARKTPRQGRAQATYDAILEAAAHIIAKSGLTAFNTNAVAERAGVSIGSLYQYFPNKDALMVALIERQQQNQADTLKAAATSLGPDADLETIVRSLVRAAMQHHHDNDLLASAIDHEEARLPIDAMLGSYLDQGGRVVAQLLQRFQNEILVVDAGTAARTLPALVRGVTDAWANLSPPQLDIAEAEAVRAVLGYLRQGSTH